MPRPPAAPMLSIQEVVELMLKIYTRKRLTYWRSTAMSLLLICSRYSAFHVAVFSHE